MKTAYALVVQLEERQTPTLKGTGSNPAGCTKKDLVIRQGLFVLIRIKTIKLYFRLSPVCLEQNILEHYYR